MHQALRISPARPGRDEPIICVPMLGMTVRVRVHALAPNHLTVIETTNAAGFGTPRYRRREQEIFEIISGRFLFEVDGQRFLARRGDLVQVPAGAVRAFVNVAGVGGRQQVVIQPGLDAAAFYRELQDTLQGHANAAALRQFSRRWRVQFLGAPLAPGPQGAGEAGEADP